MSELEEMELNARGEPKKVPEMLSPTSINTYYKCPREFYYNYIMKEKISLNIHLVKGSVVHKVLEDFYKTYQKDSEKWLKDKFEDEWTKSDSKISMLEMTDEEIELHKKDGLRMVMDFYALHKRKMDALVLNEKAENEQHAFYLTKPRFREMKVKSDKLHCIGMIDRIHKDFNGIMTLGDYKTSSKFGIGIPEPYKRQLAIYSLLYDESQNEMPDFVAIIFLRYGEEYLLEVTPSLLRYARDSISHVWNNTRSASESDYPLREGGLCRWCSFRSLCSGKKEHEEKQRKEELKQQIKGGDK